MPTDRILSAFVDEFEKTAGLARRLAKQYKGKPLPATMPDYVRAKVMANRAGRRAAAHIPKSSSLGATAAETAKARGTVSWYKGVGSASKDRSNIALRRAASTTVPAERSTRTAMASKPRDRRVSTNVTWHG